jgi:hypothetical protein
MRCRSKDFIALDLDFGAGVSEVSAVVPLWFAEYRTRTVTCLLKRRSARVARAAPSIGRDIH